MYARTKNGSIVWASMPAFYQRTCGPSGCLFKYDEPDAQCSNGRTGEVVQKCWRSCDARITPGLLCGKCPNETQVDLTLTKCLDCKLWHAVLLVAIGEKCLYLHALPLMAIFFCSVGLRRGVCSGHDLQHRHPQRNARVRVLHPGGGVRVRIRQHRLGEHVTILINYTRTAQSANCEVISPYFLVEYFNTSKHLTSYNFTCRS